MDDYALVFNAGSSSLKFCVYSRPAEEGWGLEARGQIDGIGTSPRLTVKDDASATIADEPRGQLIDRLVHLPRLRDFAEKLGQGDGLRLARVSHA